MTANRIDASIHLYCKTCDNAHEPAGFRTQCAECGGGALEYRVSDHARFVEDDIDSLWRFRSLIPLGQESRVVSMGEGHSQIIELESLRDTLGGAQLFMLMDSHKNPTGVFKDREASIIISKALEAGIDGLVFYSTANTGRSYTHYAAQAGLTSYCFLPEACAYKNTARIRREARNHFIYVSDSYPQISPFAKRFAKVNGLHSIAPLHDRIEAYATVAYEQHSRLPQCTHFLQTIASGMGPIGFLQGYRHLLSMGVASREQVPKIVCVQSSETNSMARAYNAGQAKMTADDMPSRFRADLYEPTLNSTNPVNNYPSLTAALQSSDGIITDVTPEQAEASAELLAGALAKHDMSLRFDLEKSCLVEFAGLLALVEGGRLGADDVILMMACGRGEDDNSGLLEPDLVISVDDADPKAVFAELGG